MRITHFMDLMYVLSASMRSYARVCWYWCLWQDNAITVICDWSFKK